MCILSDISRNSKKCEIEYCYCKVVLDIHAWSSAITLTYACSEAHSGALGHNVTLIDNILQELVPEHHAIGCIFALHIKANSASIAVPSSGTVNGVFLQQVKRVIMGGNAHQLRFVRRQVCDLCRIFTEHCRR